MDRIRRRWTELHCQIHSWFGPPPWVWLGHLGSWVGFLNANFINWILKISAQEKIRLSCFIPWDPTYLKYGLTLHSVITFLIGINALDQCALNRFGNEFKKYDSYGGPQIPQEEYNHIIAYYGDLYKDLIYSPPMPLAPHSLRSNFMTNFVDYPSPKPWFLMACLPSFRSTLSQSFRHMSFMMFVNFGDVNYPPECWFIGWIHLFCKTQKPPNKPEALRPICRITLSRLRCQWLHAAAFPMFRRMPLYAYLPDVAYQLGMDMRSNLLYISGYICLHRIWYSRMNMKSIREA